jgi:PII-like signaling protein
MMNTPLYRAIAGKRLRLFVSEAETWQGKPLAQVVVEQARQHGIRGATVVRGIEGFGPEHYLTTERFPDVAVNLPLIIDLVDTNERIEAILPLLDHLLQRGMITASPVEIIEGSELAE